MSSTTEAKLLTYQDISTHNNKSDCWLIISNKVYDVTPFLYEHPGGEDIILKATGRDATEDYNGVNHSGEATGILQKYYVGDLDTSSLPAKKQYNPISVVAKQISTSKSVGIFRVLLPLLIIALAYGIFQIYKKD
ncbi:hypothetical protein DCAR_0624039 [Daucus carota subsp. sativus]|uniref:Cytochrome b5 heme-binding domain-containing protein n=1 Tax=Daucus carota subsp. sativus TaxID=79200 RepID=A0AAF1B4S6_DAUCS|nr:PREDICTED: cytochrome b5-like [Daucus carota subsp. sativus]XP_017258348.1 PREDICTED: cytochrome b5-like [Daucus carota subsp. sativus]WOH04628.1 hypothetical protein DCAR_0624039 [Daucus carota subsp. sativus]